MFIGCFNIQPTTIKSPILPAALNVAIINKYLIIKIGTSWISNIDEMVIITNGDKPTMRYCNLEKYHWGAAANAYPALSEKVGRSWVNNQKNNPWVSSWKISMIRIESRKTPILKREKEEKKPSIPLLNGLIGVNLVISLENNQPKKNRSRTATKFSQRTVLEPDRFKVL
jgi:hypothetical protein